MPSPTGTPLREVGVLAGLAVAAAATVGVAYLVREGAPGTGAIPGPGTGSPSLSPSASSSAAEAGPSPSQTTPEELKAKNIAEAKQLVVDYYAAEAEVANAGYAGWDERLRVYWADLNFAQGFGKVYGDADAAGEHTTGAPVVGSVEVTGYEASDMGTERVFVTACVDYAAVKMFGGDGNEIPRDAAVPTRFLVDYSIGHRAADEQWAIYDQAAKPGEPC
jgi:hypothetical protein